MVVHLPQNYMANLETEKFMCVACNLTNEGLKHVSSSYSGPIRHLGGLHGISNWAKRVRVIMLLHYHYVPMYQI